MARTAVTVNSLTRDVSNTVTKQAFDIANDHSIDVTAVQDEDLAVFIEVTNTVAGTFTVKKGVGARAIIGDLAITTGAATLRCLDLETARFKDNEGKILIDITSTGVTGNIYVIKKK